VQTLSPSQTSASRDVDSISGTSKFELDSSRNAQLCFSNVEEILDYTTQHWRTNFVTESLTLKEEIDPFIIRPFFMLVSVDAPLLHRFRRSPRSNLEDFVREDDVLVYGDTDKYTSFTLPLCQLNENVKLQILNSFDNIPDLHAYLDRLNLLDPSRLRPSWDSYFMTLASLAAQRSNCMKRRVGAILVRDHRILATGYNGTSRGLTNCNEGGCPLCNDITSPLQCICLHAEENAILEAGRERIGMSAVLYCNTCPCLKCTIIIIQAGVKEVVYELSYKVDEESAKRFEEAGVKLRRWTRFPQLELQHELQDTLATNSVIPPVA
jgi:dCMP deaminase